MSAEQGGPPVHVVFRLDHVDHLVGVQLEPALQLIQAVHTLHALLAVSFLPFLFPLFSTTLTLPDPPQVPTKQKALKDESWSRQIPTTPPRVFLLDAFTALIIILITYIPKTISTVAINRIKSSYLLLLPLIQDPLVLAKVDCQWF